MSFKVGLLPSRDPDNPVFLVLFLLETSNSPTHQLSIKLYFFRNYRPDARSICHMGVNECFPDYDIFKVYQWKNITFPQQVGGALESLFSL